MQTSKKSSMNAEELRAFLERNPDRIRITMILVTLAVMHRKCRPQIIAACAACAVFAYFVPWLAVLAVMIFFYLVRPLDFCAVVGRIYNFLHP